MALRETHPVTLQPAVGALVAEEPSASACANCGAVLQGRFCHACGQSSDIANNIRGLLQDLAIRITNFDYSALRGLWRLILRPGPLALDWTKGKRVGVITPWQTAFLAVSLCYIAPVAIDFLVLKAAPATQRIGGTDDPFDRFMGAGFLITLIPLHFTALCLVCIRRAGATAYLNLVVTLYQLGGFLVVLLPAMMGFRYGLVSMGALPFFTPLLAVGVHVGLMLRGAYGFTWFGAAWRTVLLMAIDLIGFAMFCAVVTSVVAGLAASAGAV